jgi:hypothetical protein
MSTQWEKDVSMNGATVGVFTYRDGSTSVVVTDDSEEGFRIRLSPTTGGNVGVGVDVEIFDDRPGTLANYTDDLKLDCGLMDQLEINDSGLFTVMVRSNTASKWSLNTGLTLQLPVPVVPAVRRAIELARSMATDKS